LETGSANEIEALLRQRGIDVARRQAKEGIALSVSDADFPRAVMMLREAGLPRQVRPGLSDAFGKKAAIATPLEERARYIDALERDIESAVLDIDGVVTARIRVVIPERAAPGAPLTLASASLLIKHRRDVDLSPLVPALVQLIKNGVPGLTGEDDRRVAIVLVPERGALAPISPVSTDSRPAPGARWAAALCAVIGLIACLGGGYGLRRQWQSRMWRSTGVSVSASATAHSSDAIDGARRKQPEQE
jgi:type III secretion protein J